MEDTKEWAYKFSHSGAIIGYSIGFIVLVIMCNSCGMEVTNTISSSSRSTFDCLRTIIVWLVSFACGWEKWNHSTPIRIVGFIILTCGVLIYNNALLIIPFMKKSN